MGRPTWKPIDSVKTGFPSKIVTLAFESAVESITKSAELSKIVILNVDFSAKFCKFYA